jgi:hypothetical protein
VENNNMKLNEHYLRIAELIVEKKRCWKGYKPTPGVKPYAKGSCIKEGSMTGQSPTKTGERVGSFMSKLASNPSTTPENYAKKRAQAQNIQLRTAARQQQERVRRGFDAETSSKAYDAAKDRFAKAYRSKKSDSGMAQQQESKTPAWQRSEGQNKEGGLNAKGRASAKAQGHNLKPPVSAEQAKKSKKSAGRRKSFCARMKGMKSKLTSKKTAGDPDSRINKSLRKWDC